MSSKYFSKIRKNIPNLIKDESAAELIEAALIYPVVIFFVFFLIYIGLYIMQSMTIAAYADKIAMVASREVSHPGYLDMFVDGQGIFSTSSTEGDYGDEESANNVISISTDNGHIALTAYRYWTEDPLGDMSSQYESILKKIIANNTILATEGTLDVKVKCENAFFTQYINVNVSQQMMDFPVLKYFGIESPTVVQTTKASVSDTDEFIRNINFAADAIEEVASRCGVPVDKIKEKIKDVKDFIEKM